VEILLGDIVSRSAATIIGLLLFAATTVSLMRTIVIPRMLRSVIADAVSWFVVGISIGIARIRKTYLKRDAVMAWAGPSVLILMLITWLILYLLSYGLILYGISGQDFGSSLRQAGSSLFTLGFADVDTSEQTIIDFVAAATGPIVIALMIGFLPTIYSSYLNREAAVTALSVSTGEPAWGPEMLSRVALQDSVATVGQDFQSWSDLASRMRMSHTMYPVLIWVRSSQPYRHYLVSLLAILDAASLTVSLTTSVDRRPAFNLLVQGGQTMEVLYAIIGNRHRGRRGLPFIGRFFPSPAEQQQVESRLPGWNRKIIAVAMASDEDALLGLRADSVESLSRKERGGITLSRAEFDSAVDMLRQSGFPIERDLDEAWIQFTAARSHYEFAAYALCEMLDAPPAPWSGKRRVPTKTVRPHSAVALLPEALHILDEDVPASDESSAPPTAETSAPPDDDSSVSPPEGAA
jgi:hypothetical protein